MTRALAISQRQTQTLLRAAEAEKAIVEITLGGTTIRLIPNCRVQEIVPVDESPEPASSWTLDDYRAWRDRNHARED